MVDCFNYWGCKSGLFKMKIFNELIANNVNFGAAIQIGERFDIVFASNGNMETCNSPYIGIRSRFGRDYSDSELFSDSKSTSSASADWTVAFFFFGQ